MQNETFETLPGGTRVYTNGVHRVGTDALLLAGFCRWRPKDSLCDLGAGCGVVLLSLVDKGLAGRTLAIELEEDALELLRRAKAENGLAAMEIRAGDLREGTTTKTGRPFDLVVANPPYFQNGALPAGQGRALARHQVTGGVADWCRAAAALLKDGGRFCLCYPPGRLAPLFAALAAHNLAPKRLQLVRHTAQEEPWLLLLEARRGGGVGLSILPDHIMNERGPTRF